MFTVSLQLTAGAARFITSGALARIFAPSILKKSRNFHRSRFALNAGEGARAPSIEGGNLEQTRSLSLPVLTSVQTICANVNPYR